MNRSPEPCETIGQRIGRLRQQLDLTQQALADRIAVSRVAVSHIEMDLSIPGERTILLLASVFQCHPAELVAGTTYPQAKAERLPETVAWYTPLDVDLKLLENDLHWLQTLSPGPDAPGLAGKPARQRLSACVYGRWAGRLERWAAICLDPAQQARLAAAQRMLREHAGVLD